MILSLLLSLIVVAHAESTGSSCSTMDMAQTHCRTKVQSATVYSIEGLDDLLRSEFEHYYKDTDARGHVYYYRRNKRHLRAFDALIHDRNTYRHGLFGQTQDHPAQRQGSLWWHLRQRGISISQLELTNVMTEWIAELYQATTCHERWIERCLKVVASLDQRETRALLALLLQEPDMDEPISNGTIQKANRLLLTRPAAGARRMAPLRGAPHVFRMGRTRAGTNRRDMSVLHRPPLRRLIDMLRAKLHRLDATQVSPSASWAANAANTTSQTDPTPQSMELAMPSALMASTVMPNQTASPMPCPDAHKSSKAGLKPLCPPLSENVSCESNRLEPLLQHACSVTGPLVRYSGQVYAMNGFSFNAINVTSVS